MARTGMQLQRSYPLFSYFFGALRRYQMIVLARQHQGRHTRTLSVCAITRCGQKLPHRIEALSLIHISEPTRPY